MHPDLVQTGYWPSQSSPRPNGFFERAQPPLPIEDLRWKQILAPLKKETQDAHVKARYQSLNVREKAQDCWEDCREAPSMVWMALSVGVPPIFIARAWLKMAGTRQWLSLSVVPFEVPFIEPFSRLFLKKDITVPEAIALFPAWARNKKIAETFPFSTVSLGPDACQTKFAEAAIFKLQANYKKTLKGYFHVKEEGLIVVSRVKKRDCDLVREAIPWRLMSLMLRKPE